MKDNKGSSIVYVRRVIVAIVFVTLAALGYPLVMTTTSIYRADLPIEEVTTLAENFKNDVHFRVPIYMDIPNALDHFVSTAQNSLDEHLYQKHPELENFWGLDLQRLQGEKDENKDYIIRFDVVDKEVNEEAVEAFFVSPFNKATTLVLTSTIVSTNKVNEFLELVLLDKIFKDEIEHFSALKTGATPASSRSDVVIPYSPKYNLVFTLLTEGGKTIQWDIEKAVELLQPALERLQHFTNFSINTQIQYYSKPSTEIGFDEERGAYVVNPDNLSTFINFGDWNLITHDISPSINFLLFFPESNYEGVPTIIDQSSTNSFLVPQWGGVKIFNKKEPVPEDTSVSITEEDLLPIMEVFTSQLFQLLGMSEQPKSPSIRIDILSRTALIKNISHALETLKSLVKLTLSLNEISVPEITKNYVGSSLEAIKKSMQQLNEHQDYAQAMTLSAEALKFSDKAFFEKEMVQQAYFPGEHKLAVFLPLLGPIGSICVLGLLKVLIELKKEKEEEKDALKAKKSE